MSNPMMDAGRERLHGLDALRGFALLLGVALHLSMAWLPGAGHWWIVADADPSLTLATGFWWIHSFRMLTFFLLAGYFGRLLLERIGTLAFVRDRLRRVTLVLVAIWPLAFTGIVLVIVWAALIKFGGDLPKESPPGPKFTPDDFPLTHLWFLWVLTLCYATMLGLRTLLARIDRCGRGAGFADAVMRLLVRPGGTVLLATPLAFALTTLPKWPMWFGIPTPDQSLYPNLAASTAFGGAFAFGWLLQRRRDLLDRLRGTGFAHLAIAIAASLACLAIVGIDPSIAGPSERSAQVAYAAAYAIAGWSWTLALAGLAQRFLSAPSPVRRYLSDSSYWVYLAHLPVVMAAQVLCAQLSAPWWIEFPMALAASLLLLLGSYALCVRHTAIGAFLNGRRQTRAPVLQTPAAVA